MGVYEELKYAMALKTVIRNMRFDRTYEELKYWPAVDPRLLYNSVLIVPMRN